MSKHSVIVASDGSVRVDHAAEALGALGDLGGATALGANVPQGGDSTYPVPQLDKLQQEIERETHKRFAVASHARSRDHARLITATQIATAMIHHGKTRGRDHDYIADKASTIANALHARYPETDMQVSWEDINKAVEAELANEMGDDASIRRVA